MQLNTPKAVSPERTGTALAHMPAIDGLRGIAILLVLFHHFTPAISGTWFTKKMLTVTHTGWIGVDLFFVLSGFLITSILLRTKNAPDYFLNFYARRTLRIFPIYYAVLAVVLLGLPALLTVPYVGTAINAAFGRLVSDLPTMINGQSWLWLYGSNVKIAVVGERWGAVNHFWSLAVEEHFYLAWPFVVYFCSRAKLKQVCLTLILAAPILRAMLFLGGFDSVVPYVLTPTRMDSMALGGLMAALLAEKDGMLKWRPAHCDRRRLLDDRPGRHRRLPPPPRPRRLRHDFRRLLAAGDRQCMDRARMRPHQERDDRMQNHQQPRARQPRPV
ncbi:MAG: acyltransferase [Tepidisphaeraceae bacterium]